MLNMLPILFSFIALISLIAFLKRRNRRDLGIFSVCSAIVVLLLLDGGAALIPAAKYDTPEDVFFNEYASQKDSMPLIIEGSESAWIVGRQPDGKIQYGLVKKADDQWIKCRQSEQILVKMVPSAAAGIFIYRCADTNDHYIMLLDNGEGINEIIDSLDSAFFRYESSDSYFAYIPGFDSSYWIEINGERPPLLK